MPGPRRVPGAITFSIDPADVRQGLARREAPRAPRPPVCPCPEPHQPTIGTIPMMQAVPFVLAAPVRVGARAVLTGVSRVAPAPISEAALAAKERWLDAPPPPTECVLVDQYAIGDASAPKRGCSRFWELFYGVAIANDVSSRPGTTSTLLGSHRALRAPLLLDARRRAGLYLCGLLDRAPVRRDEPQQRRGRADDGRRVHGRGRLLHVLLLPLARRPTRTGRRSRACSTTRPSTSASP